MTVRAGALAAMLTCGAVALGGCERSAPVVAAEPMDETPPMSSTAGVVHFYWGKIPDRVRDAAWDGEAGVPRGGLPPSETPQARILLAAAKQAYSAERLRAVRATIPAPTPATEGALKRLWEATRPDAAVADPRLREIAGAIPQSALFTEAQLAIVVFARAIADMQAGPVADPRARAAEQVQRARAQFAAGQLGDRVLVEADPDLVSGLSVLSTADQQALARAFLEEPGRTETARMLAAFRSANDAALADALARAYSANGTSSRAA